MVASFASEVSVGVIRGSSLASCGSVGYVRRLVESVALLVDSVLMQSEALSRQLLFVLSHGPSLAIFGQVLLVDRFFIPGSFFLLTVAGRPTLRMRSASGPLYHGEVHRNYSLSTIQYLFIELHTTCFWVLTGNASTDGDRHG